MNCVVFDKTGTLTTGNPVVVNTRLLKNMVLRDFYEYGAAAEVEYLSLFVRVILGSYYETPVDHMQHLG